VCGAAWGALRSRIVRAGLHLRKMLSEAWFSARRPSWEGGGAAGACDQSSEEQSAHRVRILKPWRRHCGPTGGPNSSYAKWGIQAREAVHLRRRYAGTGGRASDKSWGHGHGGMYAPRTCECVFETGGRGDENPLPACRNP